MNEDEISREMYRAAVAAPDIDVLSWQAVSGKSYLTHDVRIRLGGITMAPDLVLILDSGLWFIEVKGTHAESLAEDEPKLRTLAMNLSEPDLLDQVERRTGITVAGLQPRYGVAFSLGAPDAACEDWILHIAWESRKADLAVMLRSF